MGLLMKRMKKPACTKSSLANAAVVFSIPSVFSAFFC